MVGHIKYRGGVSHAIFAIVAKGKTTSVCPAQFGVVAVGTGDLFGFREAGIKEKELAQFFFSFGIRVTLRERAFRQGANFYITSLDAFVQMGGFPFVGISTAIGFSELGDVLGFV
ncbi:hypothetical protein HMPREF1551_02730 [Capnocytophaga sp. oral taxon 863 str. F0517]|nr:hypothetical protein HMPREF1551_02730 [Capnocytophaga sp. oral taxon 863 str. F0517]